MGQRSPKDLVKAHENTESGKRQKKGLKKVNGPKMPKRKMGHRSPQAT